MDLIERIDCYRFDRVKNEWILLHDLPADIQITPVGHGDLSYGKVYFTKARTEHDCHFHYDDANHALYISPRYEESMNLADLIKKSERSPPEGVYIILEGIDGWLNTGFQGIKVVKRVPLLIDVEAIPDRKKLPAGKS